jgi:hypothetical protein
LHICAALGRLTHCPNLTWRRRRRRKRRRRLMMKLFFVGTGINYGRKSYVSGQAGTASIK